jgi:hypothetical protein
MSSSLQASTTGRLFGAQPFPRNNILLFKTWEYAPVSYSWPFFTINLGGICCFMSVDAKMDSPTHSELDLYSLRILYYFPYAPVSQSRISSDVHPQANKM